MGLIFGKNINVRCQYEEMIDDHFKNLIVENEVDCKKLTKVFDDAVKLRSLKNNPDFPENYISSAKQIKYYIKHPELYVQPEDAKGFVDFITDRVVRNIEKLLALFHNDNREAKLRERKEKIEAARSRKRALDKEWEEIAPERKRPRLMPTDDLYTFLLPWASENTLKSFFDDTSVIKSDLVMKGYITQEELLSLTINQFLLYGSPKNLKYLDTLCLDRKPTLEDLHRMTLERLRKKIEDFPCLPRFINLPLELRNEKKIFLNVLQKAPKGLFLNHLLLEHAPNLQTDRECVLKAVENHWLAIKHAPVFQNDPEITRIAFEQSPFAFQYLPILHSNRDLVLETVRAEGAMMEFAPLFKNDFEIKWTAVKSNWKALEFIQVNHDPADRKRVLKTIGQNYQAMQFAGPFRSDREFCKEALDYSGLVLEFIPEYQGDLELVFIAVRVNGRALEFAPNFHDDRRIVEIALKNNGSALLWAAPEFKQDSKIVFEAATSCGKALKYADPRFLTLHKYVLAAAKTYPKILKYATTFNSDFTIAKKNLESHFYCVEYFHSSLHANETIALEFLKKARKHLGQLAPVYDHDHDHLQDARWSYEAEICLYFKKYFLPFFKDNEFVLLEAVTTAPMLYLDLPSKLKKDLSFFQKAYAKNKRCGLRYLPYSLLDNPVFLRSFLDENIQLIYQIPMGLRLKYDYFSLRGSSRNEVRSLINSVQEWDSDVLERLKEDWETVFDDYHALTRDEELCLMVIETSPEAILRAEYDSSDFVIKALQRNIDVIGLIDSMRYTEADIHKYIHYFNSIESPELSSLFLERFFKEVQCPIDFLCSDSVARKCFAGFLTEYPEKIDDYQKQTGKWHEFVKSLIAADGRLLLRLPEYAKDPDVVFSALIQHPPLLLNLEILEIIVPEDIVLLAIAENPIVLKFAEQLSCYSEVVKKAYLLNPNLCLDNKQLYEQASKSFVDSFFAD